MHIIIRLLSVWDFFFTMAKFMIFILLRIRASRHQQYYSGILFLYAHAPARACTNKSNRPNKAHYPPTSIQCNYVNKYIRSTCAFGNIFVGPCDSLAQNILKTRMWSVRCMNERFFFLGSKMYIRLHNNVWWWRLCLFSSWTNIMKADADWHLGLVEIIHVADKRNRSENS